MQNNVLEGFAQGNLTVVERAVMEKFAHIERCSIFLSSHNTPTPNVVDWEACNAGEHLFYFDSSLITLDYPAMAAIVTRWLACLKIVDAYNTSVRPTGRTSFDLGDVSLGYGLRFSDHRSDAWLIPDSDFLSSNSYEGAREAFGTGAPTWDYRQTIAIWRGSSSGRSSTGLMQIPRVQLCRLAAQEDAQGLIDAGITAIVQARTPEEAEVLQNSGLCRFHMPLSNIVNFKMQIDVDGNSNAWAGLFQKLLTGSAVLKVASNQGCRQWYYSRLVPWQNYVPVSADMSDLKDIVKYLVAHDTVAQAIGAAGRQLVTAMTLEAEVKACLDTVEGAMRENAWRATHMKDA